MQPLLAQVETAIRSRQLLARGERVLVAVSGGLDSMALLHLLHQLAPAAGWRLTVAHFNHQLRGRSSAADERLVRRTALQLALPFVAGGADVRMHARKLGLSVEMAARQLRHEFLARTARRRKISTVVLAHHADDQVEQFFLRLLRGSGGEGLAGMKWQGVSPAASGVRLVRPLLDFFRAELAAFVREEKISFREDASNAGLEFQRNRIRHELLPLLRQKYQPALPRAILRAMDVVGAEAEFVRATAQQWLTRKSRPLFGNLPVAVQRRALQLQLHALGLAPDYDLIEGLRRAADAKIAVGPRLTVWRDAAGAVQTGQQIVAVAGRKNVTSLRRNRPQWVELQQTDHIIMGSLRLTWKIEPQRVYHCPKPVPGCECFDAAAVGNRICLRYWQPGDRFQPIGMKMAVKLQDLFVNLKIPRPHRRELVVATTAAGEVFWVEGLRMGEWFKLTPLTRHRLYWGWMPRAITEVAAGPAT